MAPGCFTMEQQQQYDNCDMLIINESSYDLENTTTKDCHNSIPLPSEPYPTTTPNDTIDSFEILEQTIMKQKRLGRSKNSDLRKKILLKRTFDLVCQIMDHENGFEEEEEELVKVEIPILDTTTNDDLIKKILNEENLFNNYNNSSHLYSNFSTSLYSPKDSSSASKKRKMTSTSSNKSNKKVKCQRRPSNSDEDEDEEFDDEEDEYNNNYISLFDDDNDPFGIADVVNFTSFKQ